DIHGGGMDLIFPHHENEIAQSCGSTGKEFARYWVHNGFVQVNKEKMSKSLGNFFTIREIFEKSEWPEDVTGEILRYFLLSTHYHGPLDFSDQGLKESKQTLDAFYDLFNRLAEPETRMLGEEDLARSITRMREEFRQGMDDDLNTSVALAAFQNFRGEVNRLVERGLSTDERRIARSVFRDLGSVLGLFQLDRWRFHAKIELAGTATLSLSVRRELTTGTDLTDSEIDAKISERNEARRAKDFKKSDEIRKYLGEQGIIIEDKPDGTCREC
ncbi:MAG: cysteine--tRNA ligase, partial [Nitrospira sp. CG24B]